KPINSRGEDDGFRFALPILRFPSAGAWVELRNRSSFAVSTKTAQRSTSPTHPLPKKVPNAHPKSFKKTREPNLVCTLYGTIVHCGALGRQQQPADVYRGMCWSSNYFLWSW